MTNKEFEKNWKEIPKEEYKNRCQRIQELLEIVVPEIKELYEKIKNIGTIANGTSH